MHPPGGQQPRRSNTMRYLVQLAACITLAGAVSQREGPETVDKVVKVRSPLPPTPHSSVCWSRQG